MILLFLISVVVGGTFCARSPRDDQARAFDWEVASTTGWKLGRVHYDIWLMKERQNNKDYWGERCNVQGTIDQFDLGVGNFVKTARDIDEQYLRGGYRVAFAEYHDSKGLPVGAGWGFLWWGRQLSLEDILGIPVERVEIVGLYLGCEGYTQNWFKTTSLSPYVRIGMWRDFLNLYWSANRLEVVCRIFGINIKKAKVGIFAAYRKSSSGDDWQIKPAVELTIGG